MTATLAELEAEVLRGIAAGKFYQNLRDPKNLGVYTDYLRVKAVQLDAVASVLGHLTPRPDRIFGNGEDALFRAEVRLAVKIRHAMDETDSPVEHLALDAVLRLELDALEILLRR